ncbi:cytochrome c552 [Actinobacillus equuli]|nr:cytochrome c552 [Actinobacillus equuli]
MFIIVSMGGGSKSPSLTDKALKHEKLGVVVESANHKFAENIRFNITHGKQLQNQPTVVVL